MDKLTLVHEKKERNMEKDMKKMLKKILRLRKSSGVTGNEKA